MGFEDFSASVALAECFHIVALDSSAQSRKNNKFFELKPHSHCGIFKKEANGEKDNIVIALNLSWILLARSQVKVTLTPYYY